MVKMMIKIRLEDKGKIEMELEKDNLLQRLEKNY